MYEARQNKEKVSRILSFSKRQSMMQFEANDMKTNMMGQKSNLLHQNHYFDICQLKDYFINAGAQPQNALINLYQGTVDEGYERILTAAEKKFGKSIFLGEGSGHLNNVITGDRLIVIGHGSGDYILTWEGPKNGRDFADILISKGLNYEKCKNFKILLLSCSNGGKFATELANRLFHRYFITCTIEGSLSKIGVERDGTPKFFFEHIMFDLIELNDLIKHMEKNNIAEFNIFNAKKIPRMLQKKEYFQGQYTIDFLIKIYQKEMSKKENYSNSPLTTVTPDLINFE